MRTTIDATGRILLTEEVRRQLGVEPGDEVVLEHRNGEWVLKAANGQAGLGQEGNVLVHRGTTAEEPDLAVAELREERYRQLTEGLRP